MPRHRSRMPHGNGFLGFGLQHSGDGHLVCELTGHSSHVYQLSAVAIAVVHDSVTVDQLH